MSGTATQGSDYTMSAAQITIPAGQSSGSVTLNAIVDNVQEKREKAVMKLQPGSGYGFPAGAKKAPSAAVTISD
jgi:hypothetical protein